MQNVNDNSPYRNQNPGELTEKQKSEREKVRKNAKKKSKKVIAILAVIAVIVIGIGIFIANKVKGTMNSVKEAMGEGTIVEEFGKKNMSSYIDLTGIVESQNVENVTTSLQYPVKEINVKVGDFVKKGDVVCTIDSSEIESKIADLEAQASDDERQKAKQLETADHNLSTAASSKDRTVDDANKAISEAKKAFDDADEDYYKKLDEYNAAVEASPGDAVTIASKKAELDAANTTWYAKQYAYDQATSAYSDTVNQANESYQSVKDSSDMTYINNTSNYSATATQLAEYYKMKGETIIIAETSGVVTSVNAEVGLPVNGKIMTIEDENSLKLDVDVREKDIFNLKEGQTVEFTNSSLENVKGSGTVDKINKFAKAGTATVSANGQAAAPENVYSAVLSVKDSKDMLLGMKVKCRIATGEEVNVNAVPYTAILTDAEGDYVYVAEESKAGMYMVVRKDVEKGLSGDYYTEITGGDLEEGMKVISFPSTVTENSIITIKE
ncbi:MAG: efflux RND transporter periplasmic adaptor subunit [Eubacterium sp.]|nr:efflux RND transporter periplasmic adaptor subunit [Eubacterium sp.]